VCSKLAPVSIVAFAVFLLIRGSNRLQAEEEEPAEEATEKDRPYCLTSIVIKATRCRNCTSELGDSQTNRSLVPLRSLDSKEAVDTIAHMVRSDDILEWEPRQEPYPGGYYCGIRDPDGNFVEFSFGQPLGPSFDE
jgi:hypothetical protein